MINPYGAGAKVYNGGSSSSQPGTLDPSGYVQREVNKPSQKRSGLAAGPLNKIAGRNQPGAVGTQPTGSAPYFQNRNPLGNILPVSDWDWETNAPTRPELKVPEGLPPDAEYNAQAISAINDFQNTARELLWNRQAAEQDYITQTRGINEELTPAQMQLRNRAAASGMGRSGIYAQSVENMLRDFTNRAQDVLAQRRLADLAYNTGLADSQANYDQIMSAAAQALSERLSAKAGKLGLGEPDEEDRYIPESSWTKQIQDIVDKSRRDTTAWNKKVQAGLKPTQTTTSSAHLGNVNSAGRLIVPIVQHKNGNKLDYMKGASGTHIRNLQNWLRANGHGHATTSGVMDIRTITALKNFQRKHGLKPDGVYGKATRNKMLSLANRK